jgi:hypothetical protein
MGRDTGRRLGKYLPQERGRHTAGIRRWVVRTGIWNMHLYGVDSCMGVVLSGRV